MGVIPNPIVAVSGSQPCCDDALESSFISDEPEPPLRTPASCLECSDDGNSGAMSADPFFLPPHRDHGGVHRKEARRENLWGLDPESMTRHPPKTRRSAS